MRALVSGDCLDLMYNPTEPNTVRTTTTPTATGDTPDVPGKRVNWKFTESAELAPVSPLGANSRPLRPRSQTRLLAILRNQRAVPLAYSTVATSRTPPAIPDTPGQTLQQSHFLIIQNEAPDVGEAWRQGFRRVRAEDRDDCGTRQSPPDRHAQHCSVTPTSLTAEVTPRTNPCPLGAFPSRHPALWLDDFRADNELLDSSTATRGRCQSVLNGMPSLVATVGPFGRSECILIIRLSHNQIAGTPCPPAAAPHADTPAAFRGRPVAIRFAVVEARVVCEDCSR